MLLLDLYDDEDDLDFIRSIRKACARDLKSSSRSASKAMLRSFLQELSFWEVPHATGSSVNSRSRGRRRISPKNSSISETSMTRDNSPDNVCKDVADTLSKPIWKTAVDPATGRTYYYDAITRTTQWHKPKEVRELEKKKRREKRKRDLEFFKEMEANILASQQRGELIPGIPIGETKKEGPPLEPLRSHRVRTISAMDEVLLAELRDDASALRHQHQHQHQTRPSILALTPTQSTTIERKGRPPLPSGPHHVQKRPPTKKGSMELSPDKTTPNLIGETELVGEKLLDEPIQSTCDLSSLPTKSPPNGHVRRNTGGTIYLQSTMENPDIKATITCICGVYRTHILQAAERGTPRSPTSVSTGLSHDINVFNDDYGVARKRKKIEIPSLADVLGFYREFYRRSQMEFDTIIVSLIYVERLMKSTHGQLSPGLHNWRSILFACMVLASKVWDDLSMWNVDFSNVSANTAGLSQFTLPRINQLELALLKCLDFDVKVPASEYAKYYFLIRTMLLRSGLVKEIEKPLGKEDAFRHLENRTNIYQNGMLAQENRRERRTKSLDTSMIDWLIGDKETPGPVLQASVCLEQLVG